MFVMSPQNESTSRKDCHSTEKNRQCNDRVLPPYDRVGLRFEPVEHLEGGSDAQKEPRHKRDQMHFSSRTEDLLKLWDAFERVRDPLATHCHSLEWTDTGSPLWISLSSSQLQFTEASVSG